MDYQESERIAQSIASGNGQQLIIYPNNSFEARVVELGGQFYLYWHDYIANYWIESFDKVSGAIARIAVLDAIANDESEYASFANDSEQFSHNWAEFSNREIKVLDKSL